jgi:hypothetical protein
MPNTAKTVAVVPKARSRKRVWTIGVLAVAATIAVAYGAGRLQASGKMEELEAHSERAIEAEQSSTAKLQAEVDAERARSTRLEARRRFHLALMALDERNFGIAQTHLQAAAALLDKSKPEPGSDLEKLRSAVAAYKLIAQEDLAADRQKVVAWVRQLDELMPLAEP